MPSNLTDRFTAIDRGVAAYRRFVECDFDDVAPAMIADLLHWYRNVCGYNLSEDRATEIVIEALETWKREVGDLTAMTGNRYRDARGRLVVHDEVHEEGPYLDIPMPSVDPEIARSIWSPPPLRTPRPGWEPTFTEAPVYDATEHPGYRDDDCNCSDCLVRRAQDDGWLQVNGRWILNPTSTPAVEFRQALRNLQEAAYSATDVWDTRRESDDEPDIDF